NRAMDIIAVDDPTDAQIQDWHAIVAAGQVHDHVDAPAQTLADTSARLLDGAQPLLWEAVEDAEAVGVAYVRLPHEPGRAGEIDVHVRPDLRRRGTGTRLLAVAAEHLRAAGGTTVVAQVLAGTPAVPFLESHGFRCVLSLQELMLSVRDLDPVR